MFPFSFFPFSFPTNRNVFGGGRNRPTLKLTFANFSVRSGHVTELGPKGCGWTGLLGKLFQRRTDPIGACLSLFVLFIPHLEGAESTGATAAIFHHERKAKRSVKTQTLTLLSPRTSTTTCLPQISYCTERQITITTHFTYIILYLEFLLHMSNLFSINMLKIILLILMRKPRLKEIKSLAFVTV